MGRHEAPPTGSAAREATAPPYIGTHETDWSEPGPDRCHSCGHQWDAGCGCLCCYEYDNHEESPRDV